ncbi:MAG: NAD(+) diphosphatase [Candidatus Competibacteraceae bacterium]|nr:NAD(+) diphosphatase [Candidatus Competibacteraceae bacterium]
MTDSFYLPRAFEPGCQPPAASAPAALWFIFAGEGLLVLSDGDIDRLPRGDWPLVRVEPLRRLFLGTLAGQPCWAAEVAGACNPGAVMSFKGLRELWGRLPEEHFALAGHGVQIIDWDRTHQFCGRCATLLEARQDERARFCPVCGLTQYPRLAPAIMVRITRDERLLLARSPRFPPGRFSVLAGFVGPGETLEQAVAREVMEEVGLEITALRYFASQPWPFPHSLMIAFTARWAGGEVRPDGEEIIEAGWYSRDDLPQLPPRLSIARRLIEDWRQK